MPIQSNKYFTQEQVDWIAWNWKEKNRKGKSNAQLTFEFNAFFKTNKSVGSIQSKASLLRLGDKKSSYIKFMKCDDWIAENYYLYPRQEFMKKYNETFGTNLGRSIENKAIKILKSRGLYKGQRPKKMWGRAFWNDEMIEWLMENKPKMTSKELVDAFNEKFNMSVKHYDSLKKIVYDHGRKLSEVRTPFVDRQNNLARMPIGAIVEVDRRQVSMIKIKNMNRRQINKWREENALKNSQGVIKDPRFIRLDLYNLGYERFPDNMLVVHLDGNWRNCSKDNCVLVEKEVAQKVWKNKWNKNSVEVAKVGIEVAKAIALMKKENIF